MMFHIWKHCQKLYSTWSSCLSKHYINSEAETRLLFWLISLLFVLFCMLLFLLYFLVNIEDPEPPRRRERQMEEKTKMVVVGSTPEEKVKRSRDNEEKATDDYHYERFKKQFRRYWCSPRSDKLQWHFQYITCSLVLFLLTLIPV